MTEDQSKPAGPDLTQGVTLDALPDGGKLVGHVGEADILLLRLGAEIFAIDALCSHYHGPLADGLVADGAVRCPWHHARFDLRTGEALAPALSPIACWSVEQRDGLVFVRGQRGIAPKKPPMAAPQRIVIIGGGGAGFAAAERLRRENFQGSIVMLSNDDAPPVDRPNLSKDFLAGSAPEDWVPLKPDSFYAENRIDLRLKAEVTGVDPHLKQVSLGDGGKIAFDRLLLATGAEPVRLPIPGADLPHVHVLRSLSDCRAIIAQASAAKRAVVVGASFIGLESAAALRARDIEVHVVAPETRPLERILGPQMGDFIRALHEEHGVIFHLGEAPVEIETGRVKLKSGGSLDADVVILGVGVRPRTQLAEAAGLHIDRGVVVDAFLETSAPGIFAAGDIARWPDPYSGASIRVEHWVVAERQGQTAALNMLGRREKYAAVPFFWSQHYDIPINYVGHAETWDELIVEGEISARDCLLRFKQHGRTLAVASIFRDLENLQAELAMEQAASSPATLSRACP
jgi:apoptosis-inducing factor 3